MVDVVDSEAGSFREANVRSVDGVWPCPFRGFHCCPDGMPGSKGFPRLMAHIKRMHLSTDDRKSVLRDALSTNVDLFVSVGEALKVSGQWLCGACMCVHALSRGCHHDDMVVRFEWVAGDAEEFVVGIAKPNAERDVISVGRVVIDEVLLDRVFSLPITTVKSIPQSCRMAFAQALRGALDRVIAMPESVEAWVRLLLLPRCTLRVFRPSSRQESRSGNRKSMQCLSIQRSLIAWGDREGFNDLILSLLAQPPQRTSHNDRPTAKIDSSVSCPNVKACLRKVMDGHFTAAVKVLCSSGVAPFGKDTLKVLVAKHPTVPPPTLPETLLSEPSLVTDAENVSSCIKSFPKGTSCGRDGLRAQHLLDAFCGDGSVIADGLLKAITTMVNLCLKGRCPKVLAEFIASAPLTPLLKPDNGIRPIAVGAIWRRLVSKVAMRGVRKDMAKYLGDFQYGVGISNGAEAVLHSANRFLNEFHSDGSLAMLTVDFTNAFNLVDRSTLLREVRTRCPSISLWVDFLYGQSARLYVGDDHILSTTGVQQGDPLGPLLFALVLHPLVLRIRDSCKLLFHAWYLDDGTIIGDAKEVAKALDVIIAEGPRLGLQLNIKKTEVFWPSCDGVKVQDGLFPSAIGRPGLGVKLLGGAVSRDAGFISNLATIRASRAVELMRCLPHLRDPQCELLLLRSCMGVGKLLFGLRTCQPIYVGEAVSVFDKGLREAIEDIVVCGGPFFGDLQWRLASLPTRFGGLGLCSAEDVSTYAFVSSRAQSWALQDHILRECDLDGLDSDYGCALERLQTSLPDFDISGFSKKDTAPPKAQHVLASALFSRISQSLEVRFDLSPRQKAVVSCLQAPRAQDYLTVIPIEGLGQHMSPL